MATWSNQGANATIVAVTGVDLAIPITITENAVARPWSSDTTTALIYDLDGTAAAVTGFTFTQGASGAATMALTMAQLTTLGVGTYRYAVINTTSGGVETAWFAGQLSVYTPDSTGTAATGTVTLAITTGGGITLTLSPAGFTEAQGDIRYAPLQGDIPYPLRPDVKMHAQACASGHGWTDTKVAGTVNLNYTGDFLLGSQSIRMITGGGGSANSCRVDAVGLTAFDYTGRQPVVWFKVVTGIANLGGIRFYIGSGAAWTNYEQLNYVGSGTDQTFSRVQEGEWYRLAIPHTVASSAGTFDKVNTTRIRWDVYDNSGGPVEVLFQGTASQVQPALYPNGVVSFTFDDSYISQMTKAVPLLDKYGWAATAYVVVEAVMSGDHATSLNLSDLYAMEARGWDIGAHAYAWATHNAVGGLTGVTAAAMTADMQNIKSWLQTYGFKASEHFAYPQGYWNAAVLAEMRKWYTACVTTRAEGYEAINPGEPLKLGRLFDSTVASNTARVTAVAANKGWQIIGLHKLASSPAALTMLESDFATILAQCATSGVAVKTISEVINSVR